MANSFTTEAFGLLGVGLFVVAVRTVARVSSVGLRGLWFDDYWMLFAAVVYSLETAAAYIVGAWWHGLANNGMTDEERRTLPVGSEEYHMRVGGSKTQMIGWSLYTLLLWSLKLCVCVFYHRLTKDVDNMRWRVRAGYFIVLSTYVATILSILFGCTTFHKNWQIYPNPGNHCQPAVSQIDLYVTVVLNVISDAYLITIPLPLFWRASLPLMKKLSLTAVFSGAFFVMAAGILRCVLIIEDPVNGAEQAGSWAVRETFVAVVVANLPIVYQGMLRWGRQVKDLTTRNSKFGSKFSSSAHSASIVESEHIATAKSMGPYDQIRVADVEMQPQRHTWSRSHPPEMFKEVTRESGDEIMLRNAGDMGGVDDGLGKREYVHAL